MVTFEGVGRWQVRFLHPAPRRAAADAAVDADGRALTVPSCARWWVGGWSGRRGGTCRAGRHLSSSTGQLGGSSGAAACRAGSSPLWRSFLGTVLEEGGNPSFPLIRPPSSGTPTFTPVFPAPPQLKHPQPVCVASCSLVPPTRFYLFSFRFLLPLQIAFFFAP